MAKTTITDRKIQSKFIDALASISRVGSCSSLENLPRVNSGYLIAPKLNIICGLLPNLGFDSCCENWNTYIEMCPASRSEHWEN